MVGVGICHAENGQVRGDDSGEAEIKRRARSRLLERGCRCTSTVTRRREAENVIKLTADIWGTIYYGTRP